MRLRGVEQAVERAAPLPMIVEIANDPAARPARSGGLRASFIIVLTASRARPKTTACFASLLSAARRLSVTLDDHEGSGPDLDDLALDDGDD
jgi:hypothetical protein